MCDIKDQRFALPLMITKGTGMNIYFLGCVEGFPSPSPPLSVTLNTAINE